MGLFGYSGAFKICDEAQALAIHEDAREKWALGWSSLAEAGDGSLEDVKVDAKTLQELFELAVLRKNERSQRTIADAAGVLLTALMSKVPGGEAAACMFLEGASKDFWKAIQDAVDGNPQDNLLFNAMKLGHADLANRLLERGWSAESFRTKWSRWGTSDGSQASFAGPWSALFWTEPELAGRFEKSWSKVGGSNKPALPDPVIEANLASSERQGDEEVEKRALGRGLARLFGGSRAALLKEEASAGLVDAVASVPDGEWISARASGLALFTAIRNYHCAPGDELYAKSLSERLAAIGRVKCEGSSRRAWIAVLFDAMIAGSSSPEVMEAAAGELARAQAGPGDKTMAGKPLEQAWEAVGGTERGLAIARCIGGPVPWARPEAKALLSEGVNASQAYQKMVERLEERPSNYGFSAIESELALPNGEFSWGWRDAQGITPLIAVCSAEPRAEADSPSGFKRQSEAESTALAILARKGARESLDARTEGLGFTALMLAVDRGYEKLAEALIDAGADPRVKDFQGRTALDRTGALLAVRLGVKMGRAINALEANESARKQLDGFAESGLVDLAAKRRQRAAYPEEQQERKPGLDPR